MGVALLLNVSFMPLCIPLVAVCVRDDGTSHVVLGRFNQRAMNPPWHARPQLTHGSVIQGQVQQLLAATSTSNGGGDLSIYLSHATNSSLPQLQELVCPLAPEATAAAETPAGPSATHAAAHDAAPPASSAPHAEASVLQSLNADSDMAAGMHVEEGLHVQQPPVQMPVICATPCVFESLLRRSGSCLEADGGQFLPWELERAKITSGAGM